MTKLFQAYVTFVLIGLCQISWGAKPELSPLIEKALNKKTSRYISEGAVVGGHAGKAHSLLNVRRKFFGNKQVERVILDLGDERGKPLQKRVSYFHVQNEPKRKRVIIDLSQMKMSKLNQTQIQNVFQKSPLVDQVALVQDPEDSGMTLILETRKTVEVEVFQKVIKKSGGKIVLDLREASSSRKL